jgi:hypothetical protein
MTLTEKYGKPQGNELVYGADIIRREICDNDNPYLVSLHSKFSVVDRFMSSKDAHAAYAQWMKENNLPDKKSQHHLDPKAWTYSRAILGLDENGEPIINDSWGKNKY